MKKILLLILPALVLSACSEKEYTVGKDVDCIGLEDSSEEVVYCTDKSGKAVDGTVVKYYESGKKHRVIELKGGYENGIEKEYYENGNLKTEANIKDSHPFGTSKLYYENGQLEMVLDFDEKGEYQVLELYDESGKQVALVAE